MTELTFRLHFSNCLSRFLHMEVGRPRDVSKFLRVRIVQVRLDLKLFRLLLTKFSRTRYENASSRLRNKRNGIFSSAIVYSIVAMTIIFTIILYIFVSSRSIEITANRLVNNTRRHKSLNSTKGGLEVIEIAARNSSELSLRPKRMKRLDSEDVSNLSPEQQKLILFPATRTRMQPRMMETKVTPYTALPPNHKLNARKIEPRSNPFRQSTLMPKPHEFLKPPTGKPYYNQVNNIQDILRSNHRNHYQPVAPTPQFAHPNHNNNLGQMSQLAQFSHNQMQTVPVQLSGKYRHPRTNVELSQIFQQSQGQLQAEGSDPFRNFKPISAFEINQMINQNTDNQQRFMKGLTTTSPYFRRKFRQKMSKHKDGNANAFGNVVQSSNRVEDRNEVSQSRPFSVMLDVFPLQGEEQEYQQQQQQLQQQMQMQKMSKFRPLMSRYYQDPHYFNTMNFPQLMPRYPPYFRYQQQQASSNNNRGVMPNNGIEKQPSQLIVHLNLYPKNGSGGASVSYKRSSTEEEEEMRMRKQKQQQQQQQEEMRKAKMAMKKNQTFDSTSSPFNINFNVLAGHNAHPENVMYHKIREFNRTSTEATNSDNYFYDDEDEDFDDQGSINVSPSLVYKNIYRDRPVHMMLRNRTTPPPSSTSRPNMIKTNQKFEYQAIKRPKTKYFDYIPKVPGPFYR
jgi:hypothetical protein